MSTSGSCKGSVSESKSNDDVCDVNNFMQKMSLVDKDNDVSVKDNTVSVCSNCGKEGNNLKACTACKLVKYCNRECQIAHRPQHKKECKKRAAELHDIDLFKEPPSQYDDCPICFIRMPTMQTGYRYQSCCGKLICSGCIYAPLFDNLGNKIDNEKCPFCRTPTPTSDEESLKRERTRVEAGDFIAIGKLGSYYADGLYGYPQDYTKALELWRRSGELGYSAAYCKIGYSYDLGIGVEVDKKKAKHYYELAAMEGDVQARYNLGNNEGKAGNTDRALKHFMIAASGGADKFLKKIKQLYIIGHATKDDYTKTLHLYQTYLGEIKSKQRDEAAAFNERYRYY